MIVGLYPISCCTGDSHRGNLYPVSHIAYIPKKSLQPDKNKLDFSSPGHIVPLEGVMWISLLSCFRASAVF